MAQDSPQPISATQPDPEGHWERHRRWVVWATAAVTAWAGILADGTYLDHADQHSTGYLIASVLGLALFAALIICVIQAIIKGHQTWRIYQRARGRYTPAERSAIALQQELHARWSDARALVRALSAGQPPPSLQQVWGVVMQPGERVVATGNVGYARYYGTSAAYTHVSGFFYGSATFMAFGYGATALGNAARRRAAQNAARTTWREIQQAPVIVTDQRVVCRVADGRWLSFYFSGATALYPEPEYWALTMQFPDTSPLRLTGPIAVVAAVVAVWAVHGGAEGVRSHPALAALRA